MTGNFVSMAQARRTLADFFVGRRKILTCQLVCGEFKQVCEMIGACRAMSDSVRSQNVLPGVVG